MSTEEDENLLLDAEGMFALRKKSDKRNPNSIHSVYQIGKVMG